MDNSIIFYYIIPIYIDIWIRRVYVTLKKRSEWQSLLHFRPMNIIFRKVEFVHKTHEALYLNVTYQWCHI